ncbi:MAG TPA: glycosyltransferase family 2 protein, partial [Geobacteraceae bacterium]|nr:glycosyltransferase family 2 protein [Geobacteraceae bacterium]
METLPELSIVTPVLDEEGTLPALMSTLSGQEGVLFELILSDGGSLDGTLELARAMGKETPFRVNIITAMRGRGEQMNAGAATSRGETILFLHADSRFSEPSALRSALDILRREIATAGVERVAGRFSLHFERRDATPSLPYYFYESKARLDRRECSHGDQGFMLKRGFFAEIGPFDGAMPMLAETRLAEIVRQRGKWLLFPAEIRTSSRRFEAEGLFERQVMNAIIMNFACQGWDTFFRELPDIYAGHDQSGRLPLAAILREIGGLIASLPLRRRLSLWYETGRYVRSHAWQIPFFLDAWRNFRNGLPVGKGDNPLLQI